MTDPGVAALFEKPVESRTRTIRAVQHRLPSLPEVGSSFFIHLSELCPVACEHCMYSSDLTRKSVKDSLSAHELEEVIDFIDDSRSEKLNITGGGEPFLKFSSILSLLRRVNVPRIEVVSAGYWANSEARASQLARMHEALKDNPHHPDVLLRLSLDRYHINAPRPVTIPHYANVVRAWQRYPVALGLGFRSIQPDMGIVDQHLADEVGAQVEVVNDWNRRIVLSDGRALPITFNVFRLSGKAAELRDDLLTETQTIREYYRPFESAPDQLSLATAVNDAIRGAYARSAGVAVTLNSDGTFWIFCGTAPDRRLLFQGQSFADAVAYFFEDPITHLLVTDGLWYLVDLVSRMDPATHLAAVAKNDVAFLVEDLLAPDDVRLAVTLLAARAMVADGRAEVSDDPGVASALSSDDLFAECCAAISAGRR